MTKRRTAALLLAASLLLTVPALAVSEGTDNFRRTLAYTGQFSDLTTGSVFYDNVAALYEYGLSVGRPDGTYGLTEPMTVGQTVIFAGRIRSLYRTGDAESGASAYAPEEDQAVCLPYLRYLQAEGVLDTALDDALATPATRAQAAHVLARVLPEEALPPIHSDLITEGFADKRFLPDVTEYTPYYQDILQLYHCGVSAGSDAAGAFHPDAPITRGAAAAMLTRIVDPALRVTPDWNFSDHSAAGTTLADLVVPGRRIAAPASAEEMDESIRYMLASGSSTLTLQYPGLSPIGARKVMEQALSGVKVYCEQSYNAVSCSYSALGTVILTFDAATADGRLEHYRTAAMDSAIAVHDQLWDSGAVTSDMTEREIARAYYTWICEHCVYDYGAGDASISHIPYGLFQNGTAVCDGYTGAYNLLLKLEGIDCIALSNSGHIWTVANLDGEEVHIDTTWGDSGHVINYDYFAMTPEMSYREHPW